MSSAKKKRKKPSELILDQSYHHAAILQLGPDGARRGRPDITHFSLLVALASPLNLEGGLQCYVHTWNDETIKIAPSARLPRNSDRFTSLLEQLYQNKIVPSIGTPLLTLKPWSIADLLGEISGDIVVACTTEGPPSTMQRVAGRLAEYRKPVLLVGGFSNGHFSKETLSHVNESYSIYREGLEAATVVARAIYDYEKLTVTK